MAISDEIRLGNREQGSELSAQDEGAALDYRGTGPVLKADIGKRVWLRDFGISMENAEQRDKRKAGEFDPRFAFEGIVDAFIEEREEDAVEPAIELAEWFRTGGSIPRWNAMELGVVFAALSFTLGIVVKGGGK